MPKSEVRKLYGEEFKKKSAIYFGKQVEFEEILSRIIEHITQL
jgi:hypothetical protein